MGSGPKQPIKKGFGFSGATGLDAFKKEYGMDKSMCSADKPLRWLEMPEAFREAVKLPGIPVGYVTSVIGHSNTGKSTIINHAMVAAQKMGIVPVYFDTENSFDFPYAVSMGFDAKPVIDKVEREVVDTETGEVKEVTTDVAVRWDGPFLYFNSEQLAERYGGIDYSTGKEGKEKRDVAVVEDVARCMEEIIRKQKKGDLDCDLLFIWDSVGSIGCYKGYASLKDNNMWTAGAISESFSNIVNSLIPGSRKMSQKHTNTFIYINKVWLEQGVTPMSPPSVQTKGGKSLRYATRLEIMMGGANGPSIKRLTAVAKGNTYSYGSVTKIKVLKNHLPEPFTVTYEGTMVCTPTGFIPNTEASIAGYKKSILPTILKKLNEFSSGDTVTEGDISFKEEEVIEDD